MILLKRAFKKYNFSFNDSQSYSHKLASIVNQQRIQTFRVIGVDGTPLSQLHKEVDSAVLNRIYKVMIQCDQMDKILYMSQRQGKISFYMPSFGEVGTTVGSSAGFNDHDLIYPQYREQGAFLWRGYTIDQMISQCIGNKLDINKGRQMPVHYGSSKLNFVNVSSPLTTQVPQASGAGYGFRIRNEDRVAVTYFGEGASSQGDFHAALNFAATLKSQTLFACRNNHYAISTHYSQQFKSSGVTQKALGYGIQSMRVDGNDVLAVYLSTKFGRSRIVKQKAPYFIEYMTYRIGDHSTSDNSALYREESQKQAWQKNNNPIVRLSNYLKKTDRKGTTDQQDEQYRNSVRQQVISKLRSQSSQKMHSVESMFEDIYDSPTQNLIQQKKQLLGHLQKHKDKYDLSKFNNS